MSNGRIDRIDESGGHADQQAGFTLVEALVAFIILSVMLLAAIEALRVAVDAKARSSVLLEAIAIAQNKIAIAGVTEPLRPSRSEGTASGGKFHWEVTEEPLGDISDPVAFRVRVTIAELPISGRQHRDLVDIETIRSVVAE